MDLFCEVSTWTIHHCKRTANRDANMLAKIVILEVQPTSPDLSPNARFVVNEERTRASAYTCAFFLHPKPVHSTASSSGHHQEASTSTWPQNRWVVNRPNQQE
ncbi:hypothetical protein AAC387_Pa12g0506 [Persea americana]